MAKILVADDDILTVGLLCLYLAKDQHDVTTASNGKEALAYLRAETFDVLITDIIMPEMDGYELLMHMLTQPSRPKIIAISAGAPALNVDTVLDMSRVLKADEVLSKPLSEETLHVAVNRLLQKP